MQTDFLKPAASAEETGSRTEKPKAVVCKEWLGGWWVVDRNHDDRKHRGPYKHSETAGGVRLEMERTASERMNEYWNLKVVRIHDAECVDDQIGGWNDLKSKTPAGFMTTPEEFDQMRRRTEAGVGAIARRKLARARSIVGPRVFGTIHFSPPTDSGGTAEKSSVSDRPDPVSKHENHPHRKVSHTESERHQAAALGGAVQGKAQGAQRARVRFTGFRVRPLDPDNFAGSVKDLLDGLRHAELIHGDETWRIILETEQVRVGTFAEERTVIEVELP